MREIRTSGLMSGEGKRVASVIPRLSSTLLALACFSVLKKLTYFPRFKRRARRIAEGSTEGSFRDRIGRDRANDTLLRAQARPLVYPEGAGTRHDENC
jgi:hypothetical protein